MAHPPAQESGSDLGGILYLLGGVLGFGAWVMGIIATDRLRRWLWFVAVLLFSPLATLLFGLCGPEERAA